MTRKLTRVPPHAQTPDYHAGYQHGYRAGRARHQRSLEANVAGLQAQAEFWRSRYEALKQQVESARTLGAVHGGSPTRVKD